MPMQVKPLDDVMATEITGVDLCAPVSDALKASLKQAIANHLVIFIRDQDLTPRELANASRLFGLLKTFVLREDRIDEAPEVSIVSNRHKLNDGKPLVQAKHWRFIPGGAGDVDAALCQDAAEGRRRYRIYQLLRRSGRVAGGGAIAGGESPCRSQVSEPTQCVLGR